jgi:hypothetical protein
MQLTPFSTLAYVIIIQVLFIQMVWLYLSRRAEGLYLGDIMHFRTPSSSLSRFYDWRVSKFTNAVIEGVVYLVILLASLILVSVVLVDFAAFMDAILYVAFMVFLSVITVVQMTWRVRGFNEREGRILSLISTATDKVGLARQMVEDLISQGRMGDGRVWFVLYRLAQRQNRVGWAIRDVLIEKRNDLKELQSYSESRNTPRSSDKGPGIET